MPIMSMALTESSHSTSIDLPFDTHKKNVKHYGRSLQSDECIYEFQVITSIQNIRQWRSSLTNVTAFLFL